MVFAQFQHDSTGWNGKDYSGPVTLIPMCGSDGVYIVDGRKTRINQIAQAKQRAAAIQHLHAHGIKGLQLYKGKSFSDAKPITKIIKL